MYNERYKFYGMHQEDFYNNPGGARRPIPHEKSYCNDDYMYLVKVDKDDPTPNYLGYKISGTDGIVVEQLVDNHDGTKTLLIKNKGGENGNYSAGEFITIDNENRIIGVSGLEDVYLTQESASNTFIEKKELDGYISILNAERELLIDSALNYWNPTYELVSSHSSYWEQAYIGTNYDAGPYISIYSGEDGHRYISASGLATQEDFEKVSADLYDVSGYIHEVMHPELITLSGVVWDIYSSCSGFPTKLSGQFDSLVSSYKEFSASIEERVYSAEGKIPIVVGDGGKISVVSSYDRITNTTTYTVSSLVEGGEKYLAGDGIYFTTSLNGNIINTSGSIRQEDFNVYSSKIDTDLNYISGYSNEVSSYIHDNEEQWLKSGNTYSAGEGIEIKPSGDYFVISTSGLDLSAGKGIKVTENPTYIEIATSGMIYNEDFESYSSKVAQDINSISSYTSEVSAYIDENKDKWLKDTTYSAGNLIDISTDKYINVISGENGVALSGDVKNLLQDINGTISNVSSNLKTDINKVSSYANDVSSYINIHQTEWSARTLYSAGEGIQFNPKGDYIEIATSGIDFSAGKGIKINEYDTYIEIETSGLLDYDNFNTYSSKVAQDINSVSSYGLGLSAYISGHESIWEKGNNYEISSNNTKLISAWKVEGEDGYTFNISANPDMGGGTTYSAGDWIDSEKLNDKDNPTISISGYKPLFVEDPLYFDVDDEKTTLKIDQQKIGIKEKVTLIANGYRNENDNVITTSGITATIPNSYRGVWNFKFDRPMVVNICINARFIPDTERYEDYYDTVGFKVTESTNPIYFTLHGYAPQHFNASTITTIPEGAEIPFSFYLGDNERESIVTDVEQPCITIQEI